MSIFKSQGIILKIKKLEEKNNLYTIFTSDYGKILCNKKIKTKEKNLDLGYFINFEIEVKGNTNIFNIRNIKILKEFNSIGQKYSTIEQFLFLLSITEKKLAENIANLELFNSLKKVLYYEKINKTKLILAQLKILNILGLLNINIEDKNLTIKKILYFISKNKIENILKLTGIEDKIESKLKQIIKKY